MKSPIILALITVILVSVVVGSGFYISTLKDDKYPLPTPNPNSQLTVNNLSALSNGTISFKATLSEGKLGVLEAVFVNGTKYLWSEGSTQNATILKGQSKTWTKNIGGLSEGNTVEVLLRATPKSANSTTIVNKADNSKPDFPDYYYDLYSGVGLFDEGVFAIATSQNPLSQLPISSFEQSYWSLMQQNITSTATNQEFISILISRGDKPTGGYSFAIKSFSWLESYPVKFRFSVNITDPGEDVIVTQALTNPTVLVPIGKLSPGEYQIEVNVVWFIQNFDEHGNVEYQPVMTFKEIVWKQNLTITNPQGNIPTTTFEMNVNQNNFSDLVLAIDLTQILTTQTAQKIADAIFIHVKGENTLHQLNSITFNNKEIIANYTWGYNQEDISHIFELKANLQNLSVEANHCK
jgi:hypothetical protein